MTKDIAYVVRIEEDENNYWLAENEDCSMCLSAKTKGFKLSPDIKGARLFSDENDVKDALRRYYGDKYYCEGHEMEASERAFVCKVSVSDCACFVKSDINILLGNLFKLNSKSI